MFFKSFDEMDATQLSLHLEAKPETLLIDVRSQAEVAQGAIPGARHVPLHLLPMVAHELPAEKPIVFYCRSGVRSAQACAFMNQRGHQNVINLRGGIMAWAQSAQPIEEPRN